MKLSFVVRSGHTFLTPGFKSRIQEIDTLMQELQEERDEIETIINFLTKSSLLEAPVEHSISTVDLPYEKNAPWFIKAKFILQKANQPLTTSEVVDSILKYEPELRRLSVTKSVSSILGAKSNEGKELERITMKGKSQKFGLK